MNLPSLRGKHVSIGRNSTLISNRQPCKNICHFLVCKEKKRGKLIEEQGGKGSRVDRGRPINVFMFSPGREESVETPIEEVPVRCRAKQSRYSRYFLVWLTPESESSGALQTRGEMQAVRIPCARSSQVVTADAGETTRKLDTGTHLDTSISNSKPLFSSLCLLALALPSSRTTFRLDPRVRVHRRRSIRGLSAVVIKMTFVC